MKKNHLYYLHIAIFLIITFGFGFLPPFAQITTVGMKVLGVFIGVIYAWCFIALDWPSMVALCALGITGYSTGGASALFLSGWSFQILPPIVLSFLLAAGISKTHLTDYISDKLLSIKWLAGKPFVLIAAILVAQAILNLLQCAYAGLFILWGLAENISTKAGYPKKNLFNTIIVTSTMAVYCWSAFIFPFNPGALMQIGFFQQGFPGLELPFTGWIFLFLTFTIAYILLWTLIIKFIFRPDFSAISQLDLTAFKKSDAIQRMDTSQKFGLSILIGFVIAMFIPKLLPDTWFITQIFTRLGLTGCLAIAVVIMVAYRKNDGEHYLDLQSASHSISWSVLWLLIATEPLAAAFNASECGIMASIMSVVTPLLTTLNPTVFLIICVIVLGAITQVVHNLVLQVVFIPLLCPLYLQMGGNPFIMLIGLVVALNAAFTTPAASWSSAMMFGMDTTLRSKMYLLGFGHFVFSLLLFFILGIPLVNIFLPY